LPRLAEKTEETVDDDLPFEFNDERAEFSDECYAAIGRALAFATRFEANCRAFATLIVVKDAHINNLIGFSLDNDEEFKTLVNGIWGKTLNNQIQKIISKYRLPLDVAEVMHKGRKARNEIAHSLTLGIGNRVEIDVDRQNILDELASLVRDIAEADSLVCFMIHLETNVPLPRADYIRGYQERIVNWVCWVEE
jgi:hypothetical protein